jgi:activator of 2-hydroxyglutaryl-CoA dehydratase
MALGAHQSIANRTAALAGGVQVEEPVVFTGGCAHSPCLVSLLSSALKRPLEVPDSPQTVAALGCALHSMASAAPNRGTGEDLPHGSSGDAQRA